MRYHFLIVGLLVIIGAPSAHAASSLAHALSGRILLQVEQKGEAWYVNPRTQVRHFLYHPDQAYQVMRQEGVGITNQNLARIPVGLYAFAGTDTDADGLTDAMETAIGTNPNAVDTDADGHGDKLEVRTGYNPRGTGRSVTDSVFARRHAGTIFLQVESRGEAWWVNPVDAKRYYLGRPEDALTLMRAFGLGVSNAHLNTIPTTTTILECGEDERCFLAAAEARQATGVTLAITVPFFGVTITPKMRYEYRPGGAAFLIRRISEETAVTISDEQHATLLAEGKTTEEIDEMLQSVKENANTGRGAVSWCTFTSPEAFATYARLTREGIFSGRYEGGKETLLDEDDSRVLAECLPDDE
jgi:hypothetical protein